MIAALSFVLRSSPLLHHNCRYLHDSALANLLFLDPCRTGGYKMLGNDFLSHIPLYIIS
jgi:hypothetical protein